MLNIDIQNTTLPQAQTTSEKDFQTNIAMVSNIVGSPETVKIWVMKKNNSILKNFYKSIEYTINYVKGVSKENDIIFVGGSTFVVSEIFDKN